MRAPQDQPALALLVVGLLVVVGWVRLARTERPLREDWRLLVAGLAGLLVIALALFSPLDELGERLFAVHMLQHLLLTYLAAPLLALAWPIVLDLWRALAQSGRPAARLPVAGAPAPGWLAWLGHPLVALAISSLGLWLWHLPAAYDLALQVSTVHDLEHLTYLAVFVLYWWVLLGLHPYRPTLTGNTARGFYLLAGATQAGLLGALIAFSTSVVYTFYQSTPHPGRFSSLQDQQVGGALMLFCGPLVYGLAAALTMQDQ